MKRISLKNAAATPWSAASLCMESGTPTVLFEHQSEVYYERAHSVLVTNPAEWIVEKGGQFVSRSSSTPSNILEADASEEIVDDPIMWMKSRHQPATTTGELPFVGGLAGYLSFEFGWYLDELHQVIRRAATPRLWVGYFPTAAIYNHCQKRWTIVGNSTPCVEALSATIEEASTAPITGVGTGARRQDLDVEPAFYRHSVEQAIDAIYGGDLFEVNYTERFAGGWKGDRRALYDDLRRQAPGSFGGIIDVPEVFIASISPEQFMSVDSNRNLCTRPIKGTRPRSEDADEDRRLAQELANSEKDQAENVMIVDLMRNDLTRVCKPGSVRATELCALYSYSSVHHLVSTVEGKLATSFTALDAFLASFPAGSITGAPKLRSMEWIAANEATPRGPYTGSMFYWSDDGQLDSNVLIRTAVMVGGDVEYGSGGAVVADSDPDAEYEEALWKAAPFFESMENS